MAEDLGVGKTPMTTCDLRAMSSGFGEACAWPWGLLRDGRCHSQGCFLLLDFVLGFPSSLLDP